MELDSSERSAFLRDKGSDAEIRAEVERLLTSTMRRADSSPRRCSTISLLSRRPRPRDFPRVSYWGTIPNSSLPLPVGVWEKSMKPMTRNYLSG
jgi:hypothetical protein